MNTVIHKRNVNNLKDIVDLLVDIGIKQIYFSGLLLSPDSKKNKKIALNFAEIKRNLTDVLEYTKKKGADIFIEKLPVCIAPKFSHNFLIELDKDMFTKLGQCDKCAYKDGCMGVQKEYIKEGSYYNVYPVKRT